VNSSGGAHARNARRLVHAARQQDRRLAAALLAAALPHTAEASEVINGARTRMSRKPAALARELLRNFPKGKGKRGSRRRKKKGAGEAPPEAVGVATAVEAVETDEAPEVEVPEVEDAESEPAPRKPARRRTTRKAAETAEATESEPAPRKPTRRRTTRKAAETADPQAGNGATVAIEEASERVRAAVEAAGDDAD
jgi:hypothetical protein